MNIAIIGGSARLKRLSMLLAESGHTATAFRHFSSLPDRLPHEVIITDIPTYKKDGSLNLEGAPLGFGLSDIAEKTQADARIIGCNCELSSRAFTDINKVELFQYKNALPSAEGAIAIAMQESAITLFKSRTLVIGYGRIAKIIADRMAAFKSDVTVAARSEKARLEALASGLNSIRTDEILNVIGEYDFIFQTVPSLMLREKELRQMKGLLIELSSDCAGTDLAVAEALSKRVIYAPGIPNRYSPETAAEILFEAVTSVITE